MPDPARLLEVYDAHLRTEAASALSVNRHGPLWLATYGEGRGWITYTDLGGADEREVRDLVAHALEHYQADPDIDRVEWKARGHDHAPGLHEALVERGFEEGETESIMIGEATGLVADVPLPGGVTLRTVTAEHDVRAMCTMDSEVFGDDAAEQTAIALLRRLALDDGMELWVAEAAQAGGRIVSAGRLEPVAGSEFAGIWGGATLPEWRGRGIYRALTAARARSALARGKTLIHSDSTEFSRPILERSGLVKVSTTTPYLWRRALRPA